MTATESAAAVLAAVKATGAAHEIIRIDPAFADTAAFCERYGYSLEESANCILVASRGEPAVYAACVVLASTRLDVNRTVRRLLGVKRLSFATPEQTREVTGMEIGGVTPFALPPELPLFVDARVAPLERVIVGGGGRDLKLLVDPAALLALPRATVVDGLALEVA